MSEREMRSFREGRAKPVTEEEVGPEVLPFLMQSKLTAWELYVWDPAIGVILWGSTNKWQTLDSPQFRSQSPGRGEKRETGWPGS